jgi:hypothetical protein
MIVPFISTIRTVPDFKATSPTSTSDGAIVGFGEDTYMMAGQGESVFIDRGRNGGVSPGQIFRVYQQPGIFGSSDITSRLEELRLPVGFIRIVDVTDVAAVGIIVNSQQELRIGDMLSKG